MKSNPLPTVAAQEAIDDSPPPYGLGIVTPRLNISRGQPVGIREIHRSRRSTLPVSRNFLPEDSRSKCSFQPTLRGPRACSISLLTQALTLGLALVSISALGRRNRIAIVFDVTQDLYHAWP